MVNNKKKGAPHKKSKRKNKSPNSLSPEEIDRLIDNSSEKRSGLVDPDNYEMDDCANNTSLHNVSTLNKNKYGVGSVIECYAQGISTRGNPIVEFYIGNQRRRLEIINNTDSSYGEKSNNLRKSLIDTLRVPVNLNENKMLEVLILKEGTNRQNYLGVCYVQKDENLTKFTIEEAHKDFIGEYVFMAVCFKKFADGFKLNSNGLFPNKSSIKLKAFNYSNDKIYGWLNSYYAAESNIKQEILLNEAELGKYLIDGSKKYGFKGINLDDKILVRVIDKFKSNNYDRMTYLFKIARTITEQDNVVDNKGNKIITAIKDKHGKIKESDFISEDLIFDLPILNITETKEFGKVGVGYITKPVNELCNCFPNYFCAFLKPVMVIGSHDQKGNILRKAKIISVGYDIIAERLI
jgi:hypothetical protein